MKDALGVDQWGLRAPTGPSDLGPRRTPAETRRLIRLLEEEPSVAGRFRAAKISEVEPGWSGARMVHGTWDRPVGPVQPGATNGDGSLPVIVKLGAGEREVHWATQLARCAPDVIPDVYAAGYALGGEPLPWLVMERCPYVLDCGWLREP